MSIFAKVTKAPAIQGEATKSVALLYAAFLVVMVVCQLFTFETFLTLFDSFNLPFSREVIGALPALIVVFELFALPFLLRMYLSPAFRWVSMVSGWLVAVIWLFLSVWVDFTNQAPQTIGFLGTLVKLMPGFWAVFVSIAFALLAAWTSWGMWPRVPHKK